MDPATSPSPPPPSSSPEQPVLRGSIAIALDQLTLSVMSIDDENDDGDDDDDDGAIIGMKNDSTTTEGRHGQVVVNQQSTFTSSSAEGDDIIWYDSVRSDCTELRAANEPKPTLDRGDNLYYLHVPEWFQFGTSSNNGSRNKRNSLIDDDDDDDDKITTISHYSNHNQSLIDDDDDDRIQVSEEGVSFRTFTLYLIRHGEANHNVLEKAAEKEAIQHSLEQGRNRDDPTTKEEVEKARKAVLEDANLRDACLTDLGKQEAAAAKERLHKIINEDGLPPPTYILVSPLTRTLETCDIIFPDLHDIHVRDGLAERRTLKPPDMPQPATTLRNKRKFRRFSLDHLSRSSIIRKAAINAMNHYNRRVPPISPTLSSSLPPPPPVNSSSNNNNDFNIPNVLVAENWTDEEDNDESGSNFFLTEEQKSELRARTKSLFRMLGQANTARSIAVVTHKGWLRELERGPFGQPDATLFRNCEIRVYTVKIAVDDDSLVDATRIH